METSLGREARSCLKIKHEKGPEDVAQFEDPGLSPQSRGVERRNTKANKTSFIR